MLEAVTVQQNGRSLANLERRSQLRRLDDLLDALEALNLRGSRVLTAGLAETLDELGIHGSRAGTPMTNLIEKVLKAQEPFMAHPAPEGRHRVERVRFDTSGLRL
jgi:hypothetical protein